jgi:hypothetical protein
MKHVIQLAGAPSAALAIMGRFSVNISYNIGLQYAAEVLPTVVRAQGVALIHIMGYVASILAPFVVYLVSFRNVYTHITNKHRELRVRKSLVN